jgi:hypothetical protein
MPRTSGFYRLEIGNKLPTSRSSNKVQNLSKMDKNQLKYLTYSYKTQN